MNKKTNKTTTRKDQLASKIAPDLNSENMSQRTGESATIARQRHAEKRKALMKRNHDLSDTSDALANVTDEDEVNQRQQQEQTQK